MVRALVVNSMKLHRTLSRTAKPYRGTAPMLAAVVAGEVQMVADVMTTSLPHIESGKLRPLAIAGAQRSPKLPGVPATVEIGYPALQAPFWLGVVAPAGTPAAIIDKLNAALRESLAPPRTRELLAKLGAEIKIGTPAEFGKLLSDELAKWTELLRHRHSTASPCSDATRPPKPNSARKSAAGSKPTFRRCCADARCGRRPRN